MELRGIRAGDIVRCEIRGEHLYALVRERDDHGLQVNVIDRHAPRGLIAHYVTARNVIGWWPRSQRVPRTAARRRGAREAALA
jgi:hypothetical protein